MTPTRLTLTRCATALYAVYFLVPSNAAAQQLILPQERTAYYADEPMELAVAGLAKGASIELQINPKQEGSAQIVLPIQGNGSTVVLAVPAGALPPGSYSFKLGTADAGTITVASGVVDSTFLTSQTIATEQLKSAGANFIVGNAFSFGRLTNGAPQTDNLRAGRSPGMATFDRAIGMDMPSLVYMYWTGYVLHKPFGSQKSWASAEMNEAMRLLSFHTAQRIRRFGKNIVSIGTIDEPGLSWGKTAAGGMASGFPNRDEVPWFTTRGWQFTDNPASRDDADWMKYIAIRCAIIKENLAQASRDIKTVWPGAVFSTDLYAPQAIMDGTDPLNQEVNDIPSSHVFVDWGIDRLGAYSGVMLEKAHQPTAKLAHAMNGQLFAKSVPQPALSHAYRAAQNGMLAAGLASNWWLNTGGMSNADLAAVNAPARRIGPLFRAAEVTDHDVAVLWSFTEDAMRQKEMAAKEAAKKTGEELAINAYNIGGDYKESVLTAHYALARAGYPAHIIDERHIPNGILSNYKTLVIVGQTFALPPAVSDALSKFQEAGGKIITDQSTTVVFSGAVQAGVNLKGLSDRWSVLLLREEKAFKTVKEASLYKTNYFMDEPVRLAVAPLKQALHSTAAAARVETQSNELLAERHRAGEGWLAMVASGFERLPAIGDDTAYAIYNYAPYQANFTLENLPEPSVVYAIEGGDWSKASKLADPKAAVHASFEPAEMKLYLVAPRDPAGIDLTASDTAGKVVVRAALKNLKMPWPLVVSIKNPSGNVLYEVFRSTNSAGAYEESFPIGAAAIAGAYEVSVTSPVASLAAQAVVNHQTQPVTAQVIA